MTVEYRTNHSQTMTDGFSQTLKEAATFFENTQHVSIIGEGFRDVVTDNQTFNTYVEKLTEGLDAQQEAQVRTLLENNRTVVLKEAAVAGIPPIASLAMPVIRKMWAKIALKYAVPTEAVSTPAFSVAFSKPYIEDAITGKKHYLPESLKDSNNGLAERQKLTEDLQAMPVVEFDILAEAGRPAEANNAIDRKFFVKEVVMEVLDSTGANPESKTVKVNTKIDINNRIYAEVSAKHSDGTITSDVVLGSMYAETGLVSATSMRGKVKQIAFQGWVSSEGHTKATNVGFEIDRRDITIGTGEHIEASLPLEFLNDTMAMYNVDGTAEVTDVMSNITSQKVDQELYNFIDASFQSKPTYKGKFNVHPAPQFAGNPKNWLEEIKRVIDHYATKMKSETYYYQGYFVIVGNPLDTQLIPNVSWSFNHVSDNQNGIDVDYSIGAMSGANRYTIIASDLIPAGELTMFFVPLTSKFMTIKYFPYTFNVVHNYLNTKNPAIPSIMMTKRHTIEEFIQLTAKIEILNNDGSITAP